MKILCVVLPRSPHTIRHVNVLAEAGWEVHVTPSYRADFLPGLHPDVHVHIPRYRGIPEVLYPDGLLRTRLALSRTSSYLLGTARSITGLDLDPGPFSLRPRGSSTRFALDGIDFGRLASYLDPGAAERVPWLAKLIDQLRPDVLHSFTIQQAGYLTMAAKTVCRTSFPPWIVSNWGIDIHYYGQLGLHREAIEIVLSQCDYYFAECWRDVELARLLGFAGAVLDVLPIGGGFELNRYQQLRAPGATSSRRLIMVKGYQGLVGRALVALRAIHEIADVLAGYRLVVYSAVHDVRMAAELLSYETGIVVEIPPFLSYEDLMRYHGQARISIGLSISDAISTSALEAMIMGAFPIQSNTSCLGEWVIDGETALLVSPDDPKSVATALRRAVTDGELVDRAKAANDKTISARLDASVVNPRLLQMYERAI